MDINKPKPLSRGWAFAGNDCKEATWYPAHDVLLAVRFLSNAKLFTKDFPHRMKCADCGKLFAIGFKIKGKEFCRKCTIQMIFGNLPYDIEEANSDGV